jgi:hypothetical protein
MLKPSVIIEAQALDIALERVSPLPVEQQKLQLQLAELGKKLDRDPNYIDRAIEEWEKLIAQYEPLAVAYQDATEDLQANEGQSRKYGEKKSHSGDREFSPENSNMTIDRDITTLTNRLLSLSEQPSKSTQQPKGIWSKLFGSK